MYSTKSIINNNESRSTSAIALYPSGNAQHSWIFMSLLTEGRLYRYQWTVKPTSQEILDRVRQLALAQEKPLVTTNFKYEFFLVFLAHSSPGNTAIPDLQSLSSILPPAHLDLMPPVVTVPDENYIVHVPSVTGDTSILDVHQGVMLE